MKPKPVTLGVIADVHFGDALPESRRRCELAEDLLERAVRRLNDEIKPDVTLVLGDLIDDGDNPDAAGQLSALREILDGLDSPFLVIPGNHDGDPDAFYRVFDRPAPIEDLCGVRFLPFIDPEAPGYNAVRSAEDLQRTRLARADGYDGPLVALQHVCLAPPDLALTPYNYTNAPEVIASYKEAGVAVSLSGHYHKGAEDIREGALTLVNTPALCEAPFYLTVISLGGGGVLTARHGLQMLESG